MLECLEDLGLALKSSLRSRSVRELGRPSEIRERLSTMVALLIRGLENRRT